MIGLGVGVPMPAGVGQVVGGFSPLDLSPVLWLDASDTSTITESGGAVSQWDDKSGNGYNLTQGTAAAQPKSGTATLNGLNVIEYDGANTQWMRNASMPWAGVSLTLFAVYEIPTDTQYALAAAASNLSNLYLADSASSSTSISSSFTSTSLYVDAVLFTGTTRANVYTAVGTNPVVIRATGTSVIHNGFDVGYSAGNLFPFGSNTKVAEMIVVETPTADQIAATESYLADKWGITL
jgi:hypothetical protein